MNTIATHDKTFQTAHGVAAIIKRDGLAAVLAAVEGFCAFEATWAQQYPAGRADALRWAKAAVIVGDAAVEIDVPDPDDDIV